MLDCLILIVIYKMTDNEFNDMDEDFHELVRGVVCTRGANRGGRRDPETLCIIK